MGNSERYARRSRMARSLPEMGNWDSVFDETYLQTYLPLANEQRTQTEALGAARLADLEPGAEILDCPTGFGRHALVLAEEATTSPASTARRRSWPRPSRAAGTPSGLGTSAATTAS